MSNVEKKSLKKNFSWNFIGSLIYSFSQFFILMILAKIGTPELVGLYSIGLAITAPIMMLTNLQLRQAQASDVNDIYIFNEYYGLRILTGFIVVVITIIIIFLNEYGTYKAIIILLIANTKIIDSYSDVTYGLLQQRERMDYIGKSRIIKGILTIIVVGVMFFITENLIIALIGMNILWFLIFYLYDRQKAKLFVKNLNPDFNLSKFKSLIKLTLPLGIVLMLSSLTTNIPRIVVERLLGDASLGYFASIAYLLVVGNTLIQSMGQAVTPRLARYYNENKIKEFKKVLLTTSTIGLIIGVIGMLFSVFFGEYILTIIYDVDYASHNNLFIIIMIAGIFTYASSILGYGITSMRIFKIQPIIGGFSVIISLISSLWLIPIHGLTGAAYVLILGAIAGLIARIIVIYLFINKE